MAVGRLLTYSLAQSLSSLTHLLTYLAAGEHGGCDPLTDILSDSLPHCLSSLTDWVAGWRTLQLTRTMEVGLLVCEAAPSSSFEGT